MSIAHPFGTVPATLTENKARLDERLWRMDEVIGAVAANNILPDLEDDGDGWEQEEAMPLDEALGGCAGSSLLAVLLDVRTTDGLIPGSDLHAQTVTTASTGDQMILITRATPEDGIPAACQLIALTDWLAMPATFATMRLIAAALFDAVATVGAARITL